MRTNLFIFIKKSLIMREKCITRSDFDHRFNIDLKKIFFFTIEGFNLFSHSPDPCKAMW